jgi:hypothetical protein
MKGILGLTKGGSRGSIGIANRCHTSRRIATTIGRMAVIYPPKLSIIFIIVAMTAMAFFQWRVEFFSAPSFAELSLP